MAFEHGSRQIQVRNPFELEGWLEVARGAIVLVLGCLLAFSVRADVAGAASPVVWLRFAVGLALVVAGLTALGRGAFKALRFYVGASVPSDLAPTRTVRGDPAYAAEQLEDMLTGRKNPTFEEPVGLVEKGVHALFPQLLFMPRPVRGITVRLGQAVVATALTLALWGLAVFSGASGLTRVTVTPVGSYFPWVVGLVLFFVWSRTLVSRGGLSALTGRADDALRLGLLVVGAIVLPVIVAQSPLGAMLPKVPLEGVYGWLGALVGLGALATALGVGLLLVRLQRAQARTSVSEVRDHWQENLHPSDLFRAFDQIMLDLRVEELPNRTYRELDPALLAEGSRDKGSFRGTVLLEIQPVPVDGASGALGVLCGAGAVVGAMLLLAGWGWLYASVSALEAWSAQAIMDLVAWPLVLLVFGGILTAVARVYRAEVVFESSLCHFTAEGTYTESKVSTGMGVHDSTRSENVVVRSNLTPQLLTARLITSTFAVSGPKNLEQLRFVLSMDKDDGLAQTIVSRLRAFADSRRVIADLRSARDLQSAGVYQHMNQPPPAAAPSGSGPRPSAPRPGGLGGVVPRAPMGGGRPLRAMPAPRAEENPDDPLDTMLDVDPRGGGFAPKGDA